MEKSSSAGVSVSLPDSSISRLTREAWTAWGSVASFSRWKVRVDMPVSAGRDITWHDFAAPHEGVHLDCADPTSEDPFMIAYTSGTTGQPKGAVHVHGGFLVRSEERRVGK